MKKSNAILQAAVAAALLTMAVGAQATTTSATSTVFAKEILQGTTPAATALTLGNLTITSNVSIPANSTVYVYVKLSGASLSALPTFTPTNAALTVRHSDGTGAAVAGAGQIATAVDLGTTTGTANPTAVAAGVDYVVFQVNTNAAVIGVGTSLGTLSGLAVNNAAGVLTTNITATASVGIGAPASRFGALAASASNHDTTSTATTLASTAQGITLAAAAGTAGKIDLTTATPSINFTGAASATQIDLGSITATDGTAKTAAAAAYAIAAGDTLGAVVTAPAGFFAPLGTTGKLWVTTTANTCAVAAPAPGVTNIAQSTAFTTKALAAAATSVTLASTGAFPPVTGTVYRVCMSIDGATTAVPGTPSIVATLTKAAGTAVDSNNVTASTNLWKLDYNGSQTDVVNYVPAAVAGFTNIIRVVNTGAVAANISVAKIAESTGTVGTAGVVATSVPAGGTVRLTQAQIEAVIGAVASTERPRLRLTAPTNGMTVQNLMYSNGVYTSITQ